MGVTALCDTLWKRLACLRCSYVPCRVMRHGTSRANESGIIVSSEANGKKREYGLTAEGEVQAKEAGELLKKFWSQVDESTMFICHSPFSRAQQTAAILAEQLTIREFDPRFQVASELRERYFGESLELQSDVGYKDVWAADEKDSSYSPKGNGESVEAVATRLKALLHKLEREHEASNILLVSHGDTLSILWALVKGRDMRCHRDYGLQTGELKPLARAVIQAPLRAPS